jgi:hypothetical protein
MAWNRATHSACPPSAAAVGDVCTNMQVPTMHMHWVEIPLFGLGTTWIRSKPTHFSGLGRTYSLFSFSDRLNLVSFLITGLKMS